jgi:hypothetical protein
VLDDQTIFLLQMTSNEVGTNTGSSAEDILDGGLRGECSFARTLNLG